MRIDETLAPNEIILFSEDGVLGIQNNWRTHGYTPLWDGMMGTGPFYITNRRIIHYREPRPGKHLEYSGGTLSLPDAIGDSVLAKEARKHGMWEYCEIHFNEVVKIEILHKGVLKNLNCLDGVYNDNIFRVHIQKIHTPYIEQVLKERELKREGLSKGKKTVIWYVNPEDVDEKKLANCRKLKLKARKHLKNGNLEKAAELFEKAVSFRPRDPETIDELNNVLWKLGEHQKYIINVDRCLEMDHSLREMRPTYHFNKGNALFNLGRFNEALAEYDLHIKVDPEIFNFSGLHKKAKTYKASGQIDEARKCLDQALEMDPDNPTLLKLKSEL